MDLSVGLKSKCKLFAGDTSLFLGVQDASTPQNDLNSDLHNGLIEDI